MLAKRRQEKNLPFNTLSSGQSELTLMFFFSFHLQMGERRGTKALELWCRRMVEGYKNVRVDNMTTSWRDGLAFCALVSKCSSLKQMPDLV